MRAGLFRRSSNWLSGLRRGIRGAGRLRHKQRVFGLRSTAQGGVQCCQAHFLRQAHDQTLFKIYSSHLKSADTLFAVIPAQAGIHQAGASLSPLQNRASPQHGSPACAGDDGGGGAIRAAALNCFGYIYFSTLCCHPGL